MDGDRVGELVRVPACHEDRDRDRLLHGPLEHHPVAPPQALQGQGKSSELVFLVRIRPREIDDQLWRRLAEHVEECIVEQIEVMAVFRSVLQRDIETSLFQFVMCMSLFQFLVLL